MTEISEKYGSELKYFKANEKYFEKVPSIIELMAGKDKGEELNKMEYVLKKGLKFANYSSNGANKSIKKAETKIFSGENCEEEKSILEYTKKEQSTQEINNYKDLICSRFFSLMGYPTFRCFLAENGRVFFEKIEIEVETNGDKKYFFKKNNGEIAKQFVKRNLFVNFFGDPDGNLNNIIVGRNKILHSIDLNICKPKERLTLKQIFNGVDYIYHINEDENLINLFDDKLLSGSSNLKNLLQNEYINISRKLILLDEESKKFITLENCVLNDYQSFRSTKNEFKKLIELYKIRSFYHLYKQNNLHNFFGLKTEDEEKIKTIFNIDQFLEENILTQENKNNENKYCEFLENLSKTEGYKMFVKCINYLNQDIKNENYSDLLEVFNEECKTIKLIQEKSPDEIKTILQNNEIENLINLKDDISVISKLQENTESKDDEKYTQNIY